MRKLIPAFFLVLMLGSSAGTNVLSENVVVDLETSEVDINMEVAEFTSERFTYLTSYPIRDVSVTVNNTELKCQVDHLQIGSEISCKPPKAENFEVHLNFKGSNLFSKRQQVNIFRYSQSFYRPISNYTLKVLLPRGTGIADRGNVSTPVISPEESEVGSIGGRRFYVEWKVNPELGQTRDFQVVYESFSADRDLGRIILAFLGFLAVLVLSYLIYLRLTRESIETTYDELSEDEIEVIEYLRGSDGEMLQKDIVKRSDYSKAKISGLVSELVEKGIIEKKKEGRSNKLSISKHYRT